VTFTDLVRGEQAFACDDIGDFIIRRADGTPAFFFCNAIDDALMGVTHVLRGEDHLTNTPRQLLLLRTLSLPVPVYGHISMITGDDNTPLSKRHGSHNLQQLREAGWLPAGLLNYLARLGHSYAPDMADSFMSFVQLAKYFDTGRLGRAPARFDPQQMRRWQHAAVGAADPATIWRWLGEAVHKQVPENRQEDFMSAIHPNILFPEDGLDWATRLFSDDCPYSEAALAEIHTAGNAFFDLACQALQTTQNDWKRLTAELKQLSGHKGKALFMPLRAALTGETHGPEMTRILTLIGTERALIRLQDAKMMSD
jgi:glutamyl-tRNA synthetase